MVILMKNGFLILIVVMVVVVLGVAGFFALQRTGFSGTGISVLEDGTQRFVNLGTDPSVTTAQKVIFETQSTIIGGDSNCEISGSCNKVAYMDYDNSGDFSVNRIIVDGNNEYGTLYCIYGNGDWNIFTGWISGKSC